MEPTMPEPTAHPDDRAFASAYVPGDGGPPIVHYQRCWPCMTDGCFEQPTWHQWADADDIGYAQETGQPDPSGQRCGCHCADAPKESR
jgi:hypothetical protein